MFQTFFPNSPDSAVWGEITGDITNQTDLVNYVAEQVAGGIQTLWGYQDFAAGAITTTSVTLTANENGTGATLGNFYNYAAIYRSDNNGYVYTSGFLGLFTGLVSVSSESGVSITLNKVPDPTTPVRIWWMYSGARPTSGYVVPPQNILNSAAAIQLDTLFVADTDIGVTVQAYNSYLTNIDQFLDTTASPTWNKVNIIQAGQTPITLTNPLLQATTSANNYTQVGIQNKNSNINASSDFVATADNGTDTTNYVNLGINSSGYSQAGWTINGAGDSYLYASNGNLAIGTAAAKSLVLFTGGTLAANAAITINSSGALQFNKLSTGILQTDASGNVSSSLVSAAQGGTGQSSYTIGDILYASASNALSKLADVATGSVLVSGGVGVAPAWSASPSVSNITVSTQITNSGAAQKDKNVVANSSTAYTIDQANGKSFEITLTANATLTLASAPTSGIEQDLIVDVIQDGTGGRTLTWGNVTEWVGVATPTYLTAAGSKTRYVFKGTSSGWVGCGIFQPTDTLNAGGISASTPGASSIAGRINGGNASSGYAGEVNSSIIAIGSAVSLTTATSKTITSISLTAGDWDVWANIGFIPAAGTIPTSFKGSIGQTDNTLDTAPNSGAYFESNITYPASLTQVFPVGKIRVNISSTTTIYLIGQSTFSVSTLTAYGALFARRAFS